MKKAKMFLSLILSIVVAATCFCIPAYAASSTVVTPPTKKIFYEGIDWLYLKDGTIGALNALDLKGTVLEYNSQKYYYKISSTTKLPNMSTNLWASEWNVGMNTIRIYCDGIPDKDYASFDLNFIKAKSITLVKQPNKTILVQGVDWKLGQFFNDVEMTTFDLSGAVIRVTYTNGDVITVYADNNARVGWSVDPEVEMFYPGPTRMFVTFCGMSVPFEAVFATSTVHSKGDINIDNKINSADALLALQQSTGAVKLTATQKSLADVSSDNAVTSLDALYILQYIVGLRYGLN